MLFFARDVLPLIQREVPDVRLLVVGSGAPPDVQRLHDGRRIAVFSDVPALEPYYRQATAAVVSLRVGGGTRLRMLEAFALGRVIGLRFERQYKIESRGNNRASQAR